MEPATCCASTRSWAAGSGGYVIQPLGGGGLLGGFFAGPMVDVTSDRHTGIGTRGLAAGPGDGASK